MTESSTTSTRIDSNAANKHDFCYAAFVNTAEDAKQLLTTN